MKRPFRPPALAVLLAVLVVTAGPGALSPVSAQSAAAPFSIDLYREGDFVSQDRSDRCVAASMLTMMNIIAGERDRPMPTQGVLHDVAVARSTWRLVPPGAEAEGWARGLDELGYGPYAVHVAATRAGALKTAARALRMTGRPVGLLVWRGAHAWVISGFEASADPAATDRFAVSHFYVHDPWYPRPRSAWGATRPPDARIAVAELDSIYLPWRRPAVRYPDKDGRFVLVLPVSRLPDRLA